MIAVTGATGTVGRELVRLLEERPTSGNVTRERHLVTAAAAGVRRS
jgi:uncharacterized protein YbjT (DUF2867 family)